MTYTLTEYIAQQPDLLERGLMALCRKETDWWERVDVLVPDTPHWAQPKPWALWIDEVGTGDRILHLELGLMRHTDRPTVAVNNIVGRVQSRFDANHRFQPGQVRGLEAFLAERGWTVTGLGGALPEFTAWRPPARACATCPNLLDCTLEGRTG